MTVVVWYEAWAEGMPNTIDRGTSAGLTTAELKGPKKARNDTCKRTSHFSQPGQFWSQSPLDQHFRAVWQDLYASTDFADL